MGLEGNIGDVKLYHEMGNVFKVEIIDIKDKTYGNSEGEEYYLRTINRRQMNPNMKKEVHPRREEVFTVWRSKDEMAKAYAGWCLTDID